MLIGRKDFKNLAHRLVYRYSEFAEPWALDFVHKMQTRSLRGGKPTKGQLLVMREFERRLDNAPRKVTTSIRRITMSTPNIDFAAMANAAASSVDMTKAPESKDFDREVAAPGRGICRLREYIELGVQPNSSALYPDKLPCRKARFVFEMCTPRHIQHIPQEGKEELVIPHVLGITIAMPDTGKSAHAKSAYFKLFSKLNYDGKLNHPAQALGRAFIVTIIAGYAKESYEGNKLKEGAKQAYANFKDADGVFLIEPPRVIDPVTEAVTEVPVPEITGAMKLFLFDQPNQECFDSLYIDGDYEKEVAGVKTKVSKNWLQNTIVGALDYEGSKVQCMIEAGNPSALDELPVGTVAKAGATTAKPKVSAAAGVVDPLAAFDL